MARNSLPDEIAPDFGDKLKYARIAKGLTQGQLAHRVGADTNRISKYENAAIVPPTGMLVKLADVLGVSVDYLIRGGDDHPVTTLRDPELLRRFTDLDVLPEADRLVVLTLIDAFVKKRKFEQLAAS